MPSKFVELLTATEETKKEKSEKALSIHSLGQKTEGKEVSAMLERVRPKIKGKEFLKLMRLDGTVFGKIYKYVKKIVGPGFTFIPDTTVSKELADIATKEAKELNEWKNKVDLVRIMKIIVKDVFLYGRGFIELCKNALENDIIFIHTVDPIYMDFQRDITTNRPAVNEYGKPVGYKYEEGALKKLLSSEEIGHFKFFEHSELDLGLTPLEPLYNVIVSKANFEKAAGEVLFRKGFPMWVLYLGKEGYEPPAGALAEADKEFKDLDRVTEMVLPYYYRLDKIEASKMEELRDYHHMFKDVIYEGFLSKIRQTPRIRRGSEIPDIEEEEIVRCFQTELGEQIVRQIVMPLCKLRKYKTIPAISFYEVKPATQLAFTRSIATLFYRGALTHDDKTENWIRTELKMPSKEANTEEHTEE